MTRKEQLEKAQAEAEAKAKAARKELAKIKRAEKRKAEQEAREKEQAEAMEFYRKYKDDIVLMNAVIKMSKKLTVSTTSDNGEKCSQTVYMWMLDEIRKGGNG